MTLRSTYSRLSEFADTPKGKRLIKIARGAFIAAVLGVLLYQLSGIGWADIWSSLPTQPLFYVILIAMYLLLPTTESLVYGRLWNLRFRDCLPVMIRKRVLNVDVVGYSGEVYFFMWAKKHVALPAKRVASTIKDNLILSSASSVGAAALLLGGLLLSGQIHLDELIDNPSPLYIVLGGFGAALVGALVFRFRHAIFFLPRRVIMSLGAIHLTRFFVGYVLQVAQWWVVIPSASFETWAILLTVFVLINRIPFLPSSDLVFLSAGAGVAPLLDVPVAPVVGMLLVRSAVDRLLNLTLFAGTVWRERQPVYTEPDLRGGLAAFNEAEASALKEEETASLNS